MKIRADILLSRKEEVRSREEAQALIMAGQVYVGEKRVNKSSEMFEEDTELLLRGPVNRLASRGYHKLEKGIRSFQADVSGKICMDIGAAAGGFTDVLLRNGAAHVYAIDVGYGQFDYQLSLDERVTVMERTNARTLTRDMFPLQPNLTVMDVSFISICLILPCAAQIMGENGRFITLVKPQFEAGRGLVGKNGVVREESTHVEVLKKTCAFAPTFGWHVQAMTFSPIKGPKGNIEFLADIVPGPGEVLSDEEIRLLVHEAHAELDNA